MLTDYEEQEYPLVEENVEIPDHDETATKIESAFTESRIENAFKETKLETTASALVPGMNSSCLQNCSISDLCYNFLLSVQVQIAPSLPARPNSKPLSRPSSATLQV